MRHQIGVSMKVGKKKTRRLLGSLGTRLFVWIFIAILSGFSAYAIFNVAANKSYCEKCALSHSQEIAEIVKDSTQFAMMRNHREDVQKIVTAVAKQKGVVGLRIFDKKGRVAFSDQQAEIGQIVNIKAESCNSCHLNDGTTLPGSFKTRERRYWLDDGTQVMGITRPINNLPRCSTGDCHAHPKNQKLLGIIDLRVSMRGVQNRQREVIKHSVIAAGLIALLAAFAAAVFIQLLVRKPVDKLVEGTERLAAGEKCVQVDLVKHDEIGRLGRAFNRMSRDLSQAREALTEWSSKLETRLSEKTEELGHTQQHVVQMEKMASLGKLSATVAHELNNPLAGILNYTKLLKRSLNDEKGRVISDADHEEMLRWLDFVAQEAKRTGDIVRNLLLFARGSGSNLSPTSLRDLLDRSLMLVQHHIQISEIRLEKQIGDGDDVIICDSDKIHQALVALLVNAVEAMTPGGVLQLAATFSEDAVQIEVADTGGGIPDDVMPHIFEPFYSTKGEAHGVGLGLAVVYGIVRKHGGDVQVETKIGEGTRFIIRLPREATMDDTQDT